MTLDDLTYRELLDQSMTGVFILVGQRIRWANQQLLHMLGTDLDALREQDAWEMVHPDDRDRVRQVAQERIAGKREGEVYETRLLACDGRVLWTEIRATPITYRGEAAVLTNAVEITDRKLAEQALQESEKRLRTFIDNAPIGIYRTTPEGKVLMANPALLRMLGYRDLAILGQRDLNREGFEPTYPRNEFRQGIDRDGRVIGLESAWIRADDTLLYVRENAQAVRGDDGQVLYYEGTVEDITRQKRASQALALYAQRLQVKQEVDQAILAAQSPAEIIRAVVSRVRRLVPCQRATVLLLDADRHQAQVFATAASDELQGTFPEGSWLPVEAVLTQQQLADRTLRNVPDIDAMEQPPAALARLRAAGMRSCLSVPLQVSGRLLGSLNLANLSPNAFDPDQEMIVSSLGDQLAIALHQSELRTQLAEQSSRLRALIEHLPDGVMLLDAQHQVVLSNPAAREALAALSADPPGELPKTLGCLALVERQPHPDVEIESPGDPPRSFQVACRPIPSNNGPAGWALVLREVTEERNLQRQLRQHERRASIGSLASGVAHDFNNLLSAINGCAWILLRRLPPGDALLKPAEDIRQTCERAASLTKRLLQFAHAQAGEPSRLSLNGVVSEMATLLDRLVGAAIELHTELALDLWLVLAERAQLEQVLVNLVINARDAMRAGGRLDIQTANLTLDAEDPSWPGGLGPGEFVCLRVQDTGAGMDPNTLEQVFEPYFTTKATEGGTGLGLATVKATVTQLQGAIRVCSAPGQGTTIEMAFPRHEPSRANSNS
jgi:PAS domain S-box-containing protein